MTNLQQVEPSAQTKVDSDLRVCLMRLSAANGGMYELARRADISYNAIWGQINRGQGILARLIPPIIDATGDAAPLHILADACGYLVAHKPAFKATCSRDVRRREVGLSVTVGRALDVIEAALSDGLINGMERDAIRDALSQVCANSLELRESLSSYGWRTR